MTVQMSSIAQTLVNGEHLSIMQDTILDPPDVAEHSIEGETIYLTDNLISSTETGLAEILKKIKERKVRRGKKKKEKIIAKQSNKTAGWVPGTHPEGKSQSVAISLSFEPSS